MDRIRGGVASPSVHNPAGIAFRAGQLYVCDTGVSALHRWDLTTGQAQRIGASGGITLAVPVDVAVDEAGSMYVADTGRSEVVSFDRSGVAGRRFKPPGRRDYRPISVAVRGSTLYVADIVEHKIDLFSTTDGRHLAAIGKAGSEPGTFYYPSGVATGASGEVWISDMMNSRVQLFDATNAVTSYFGQPGNRYGDMGKPRHLDVGPDGTILVADAEFAHVHLFDTRGRLLLLVGGASDELGGTPMPVGVAVAPVLPEAVTRLVPEGFRAEYFFFVTSSIGRERISLFAVGRPQ